jgi:DUF4097 and DUF4098 domain-containing protein YvlB
MIITGSAKKLRLAVLILILFRVGAAKDSSVREGVIEAKGAGQPDFIIDTRANVNGQIQIITNPAGNIRVTYKITATAESKADANRFLDLVDIKLNTKSDERALLNIVAPSHVPWSGSDYGVNAELLLEIPEKINIEGNCRYMGLEIIGPFQDIDLKCEKSSVGLNQIYGSVKISTTNSDINLNSIRGDLGINTTNGAIVVTGTEIVSGYALLETTNGAITLDGIRGSVEAYTTYAAISARNVNAVEGSVVLRTDYAPIEVSNVSGEIICETNYYPIKIEGAIINHGHSKIETSYAPIEIQASGLENCEVYISSEYNNIDLELPSQSSTRLVASVDEGGIIHTKGIAIIPILLEPTRLEGILGEGEARVEAKVSGVGNINITGR